MSYEPKEGFGAFFKNDKGDNPSRPDYRGDIMLGGVLYELSAWIKPLPSDASKRFMSISGKPKQARPQEQSARQQPRQEQRRSSGFDDIGDCPF